MAKLPTVKKAIEISDNPAAFISYEVNDAIITLCDRGLNGMTSGIVADSTRRVKILRAELNGRGEVDWSDEL